MNKLWMIVGVIIIVAVVGYGGYRAMHHFTKPTTPAPTTTTETKQTQPSPSTEAMMAKNSVYKMMEKGKLGNVMTDLKGNTLYTYTKDTNGSSTCTGKCIDNWPAYVAPSQAGDLPANVTIIKRTDGTMQYAWKGMPLYYYIKDKDSGDAYGDGVGGVWYVIKM